MGAKQGGAGPWNRRIGRKVSDDIVVRGSRSEVIGRSSVMFWARRRVKPRYFGIWWRWLGVIEARRERPGCVTLDLSAADKCLRLLQGQCFAFQPCEKSRATRALEPQFLLRCRRADHEGHRFSVSASGHLWMPGTGVSTRGHRCCWDSGS